MTAARVDPESPGTIAPAASADGADGAPGGRPERPRTGWADIAPAPRREPEFDDERQTPHLTLLGQDAPLLPFPTVSTELPRPDASPARSPGATSAGSAVAGGPRPAGSGPTRPASTTDLTARATRRGALPDPARFGRHFIQGVLEVFTGRRPPGQLAASASMGVHAGLARDLLRGDRLGLTAGPTTLHSIRVMEPADGVAELTAVIQVGPRYRAIAARLEGIDGRWRCVRLQIG